jgi:hypothetical protein
MMERIPQDPLWNTLHLANFNINANISIMFILLIKDIKVQTNGVPLGGSKLAELLRGALNLSTPTLLSTK